ncbi:MAG: tRNA uridine-5-carboxymethylaminomethyl(34) synthesis enzyme MnmG [Clostridia bacterium]|nr:tRNA uridine-5-carboxymethylaminomethyl(34) synthesis enzyme MnmG [Clostridia bacterium]
MINDRLIEDNFDAVVIGAGHAGVEAAMALSKLGKRTALMTLNADSIAFMACNPSIGGTAKGHLVRELDALGGFMGIAADKCALQIKMLNRGKGVAVQSLRAQADKAYYHRYVKQQLEKTENLRILQAEAVKILTENGRVCGVETGYGSILTAKAVVVCSGVYLNSKVIAGEWYKYTGPNGFEPANKLTQSLIELGFNVRRFKTGTPARVDGRTIDYSKCTRQDGETNVYPFSFLSKRVPQKQTPCYLTYTNEKTHEIIRANLDRSPLYNGTITSTGPRYCPSIETKVERFKDKERHQIFLEPEGADTQEVYVQGMSTSLPQDVQRAMYRTIAGLENCEIVRYGYAIEYDCIDSLDLLPTLQFKKAEGLYTAGQINGTSGYEEAAAQGLIAGINAALYIDGKQPFTLDRSQAYIGVMIDDLVTKGTDEPYRMMTSRAEYRLLLRQDNADLRLTQLGRDIGLVDDKRYKIFLKRKKLLSDGEQLLKTVVPFSKAKPFVEAYGGTLSGSLTYSDMIKRGIPLADIIQTFGGFDGYPFDVLDTLETNARYEGYLERNLKEIERAKKMEQKLLPKDIDYLKIEGLRIEAREKLNAVRPLNLGQAERIPGVNPADIAVLMIYLKN